MKVVFATPRPFSLAFGGSEVQLLKTKEAVERQGIKVELMNYFSSDLMKDADIVHLFGSDAVFYQIAGLVHSQGRKLVVSSIFYPVGVSLLKNYLGARIYRSQVWLRSLVLRTADIILPNSHAEAKRIRLLFKIDESRMRVIPNGVDKNFVGNSPESFRNKYLKDLPQGEPFILSVGRIESRKNSVMLLKAAKKLNAPIVFIGRPVDSEKSYIRKFFEEMDQYRGYAKHIEFLPPYSEELANAYAAAHVHALISRLETPGLASLEAGLNGANLVVGDCSPVREYFDEIAWIVNPSSLGEVVRALENALNAPRDSMMQSSFIRERFSWDAVGKLMSTVYNELLLGGG